MNKGAPSAKSIEIEVLGAPPLEPPFERAVIDRGDRYEVKVTSLSRDISLKNGDVSIKSAPLVKAKMRMERLDQLELSVAGGARVVHKGSRRTTRSPIAASSTDCSSRPSSVKTISRPAITSTSPTTRCTGRA